MAKHTGLTVPADLADGDIITETWVDNTRTAINALDSESGRRVVVANNCTYVDWTNTAAEYTCINYTIPGGTLVNGKAIRFNSWWHIYNNTGATTTQNFKVTYGATSIVDLNIKNNGGVANTPYNMHGIFRSSTGSSAQTLLTFGEKGTGYTNTFDFITTSAEDSTGDLDFKIIFYNGSALATYGGYHLLTTVELMQS